MKTLEFNPSYDVPQDIFDKIHLLDHQCIDSKKDPFTFLNQFLPLRMHTDTRTALETTFRRFKMLNSEPYYGLLLAEKTVVSILRTDPKI